MASSRIFFGGVIAIILTGQQKGKPHDADFLFTLNETINGSPMLQGVIKCLITSQLAIND